MEFVPEEGKQLHEDCSTLILPALSIGNVGQLVADLLISSMGSERVGYLDDPNVLPCVGNDAYGPFPQGDLALPLEAYDSPSNALTVIQQRSPVIKGMMVEFAKNMADFIAGIGKKHIIVLSSLDFGKWQKVDMSRFITFPVPTAMEQMKIVNSLGGRSFRSMTLLKSIGNILVI